MLDGLAYTAAYRMTTSNILLSGDDAASDFMIKGITKFTLFGQEVWITTTYVSVILVMLTLIVFAIAANIIIRKANPESVPGGFQNTVECVVETLQKMVGGTMGKNGKKFVNYISTIFLFILLSNLSGLLGLRAPTADYGVTLPLGIITFVLIQYNGIKTHKMGHFTELFKPLPFLFPINLIGEIAVPFSLSLRLFGNILAGTVMLGLYYGLLPWFVKLGIPTFLHAYLDLFSGCIQTYVFCMLTMTFINQKMETE